MLLHALSRPSTTYASPLRGSRVRRARSLLVAGGGLPPPPPNTQHFPKGCLQVDKSSTLLHFANLRATLQENFLK